MTDYTIEPFGKFNNLEIRSILDKYDRYWFTQDTVADALGVDRTAIVHIRSNHPEEFSEGIEYQSMVIDGRRKIVYSEEGFLTVCDMSSSNIAFRLRRWMRKQFRVKQEGKTLTIQHREVAKSLPTEDLSDLHPQTIMLKTMVDTIIRQEREIKRIDRQQISLQEKQERLKEELEQTKSAVQAIEERAQLQPGEMTALQLAQHCGWLSKSSAPHNLAVILAAINEGYHLEEFLVQRYEEGPEQREVPVYVFTIEGVTKFVTEIDSKYSSGQKFTITPESLAQRLGKTHRRYVFKV